ncbi:MAG: DNA polymerase IV, partial [Chloroflexota bacterium]
RIILHLDLDAFYCAVEEQRDPALKGQPFAVGGDADRRGVVASCSYPARVYGVRSAMPMAQAVHRCPDLIIVRPHFDQYRAMSHKVMAILHNLTPMVEQLSIDEAFLDVTGIQKTGGQIARELQVQINTELALPCSLGVATNKLVAKIANNRGKAEATKGIYPNAIRVIPEGGEADFFAPLSITELWGVGQKTADSLRNLGITTIGELATYPQSELTRLFGKHGTDLAQRAKGIDIRRVEPEHEAKSINKETTFSRDVRDGEQLRQTLRRLSDSVGYRLRKANLNGTTIKIKLRWSDFSTLTRQTTLSYPVNQDDEIYEAAIQLFEQNWPEGRPVRLIGVGVSGFSDTPHQLGLFDKPEEPENRQLQSTLDEIRQRFGESAIKRGTDVDSE